MSLLKKLQEKGINIALFGCLQFFVLTILAMFLYTGGTLNDGNATHYIFTENFFSDLGRTYDLGGDNNFKAYILFTIALTGLGVSVMIFFISISSVFPKNNIQKFISLSMIVLGVISGLCFIGVAFTPADLLLQEHIFFVRLGFRLLLLSCIFLVVNIFKTSYFPSSYAYIMLSITVVLLGYILLLQFGPSPLESKQGLIIQAAGQKIIVYLLILGVVILGIGGKKVLQIEKTT